MAVKMIVSFARSNRVMGIDGRLPWHMPSDLARFRKLTTDHIVAMGRNTWSSLPARPLSARLNWVLTSTPFDPLTHPSPETTRTFKTVDSMMEAYYGSYSVRRDLWIIGGTRVYQEAMMYASEIHATEIQGLFEGDVYFPAIPSCFYPSHIESFPDYSYVTYKRR